MRPPATKFEWSDQYVLVVLVLMLMLYCTRGVAETVLGVLACVEACVGVNVCEHCAYHNSLQLLARMLLDLYFGMHPVLLLVVTVALQSAAVPRVSSTLLSTLRLANASAYYSHTDAAGVADTPTLDARSRVDEVEYIMWAMPFALGMALSYMCLSRAFHSHEISEESDWNEDALEGCVFGYEICYHLELFLMNLSLLGTSCSEQSLGLVVYASATLTLLQAYFIAGSRAEMGCHAHAVLSMLVAALFVLLIVSVLSYVHTCIISRVLGMLLVLCSCAVVLGHHSCFGRAKAVYVIVMRLGISAVVSLAHIIVMAVGRNAVCVA